MQVRNSWVVRGEKEAQPFLDKAEWETIERTNQVEKWIEDQLKGTSVTVVLIGAETFSRQWVKHEIKRSHELGKGMLGIYIQNIKDPQTGTDYKGRNPFEHWSANGVSFTQLYPTYDWVNDDGYKNISSWIEKAAVKAGR